MLFGSGVDMHLTVIDEHFIKCDSRNCRRAANKGKLRKCKDAKHLFVLNPSGSFTSRRLLPATEPLMVQAKQA